jgi:selenide,water dikinase
VKDPSLLAGLEDDAAVYKLREDLAIVVSVDYFNPIVRVAYRYGQIAAANALSDIYAMGARPIIAMNIVCFPSGSMELGLLDEILRGGSDKLREAGVLLVGGHTVIDPKEIKYGLSVTGVVHPGRILRKGGLKAGDALVLTKALGTGIINNALNGGLLDEGTEREAARSMAALNKHASEIAVEARAHACTDVTGFGLAGHMLEMIRQSEGVGIQVEASALPLLPRVEEFAKAGLIPPGTRRNRKCQGGDVSFGGDVPDWRQWILFDAQTSGGLMISVPRPEAEKLVGELRAQGVEQAVVIGRVIEDPGTKIVVR